MLFLACLYHGYCFWSPSKRSNETIKQVIKGQYLQVWFCYEGIAL